MALNPTSIFDFASIHFLGPWVLFFWLAAAWWPLGFGMQPRHWIYLGPDFQAEGTRATSRRNCCKRSERVRHLRAISKEKYSPSTLVKHIHSLIVGHGYSSSVVGLPWQAWGTCKTCHLCGITCLTQVHFSPAAR